MCTRPPRAALRAIVSAAVLAATLAATGCAFVPKEHVVRMPTSARPQPQPAAPSTGSIYALGGNPLFEDGRPRNVGDILTVVINEKVNASKNSGTSAQRGADASLSFDAVPKAIGGLVGAAQNAKMDGSTNLKASGGASAANTFNGTLTVTVVEVLHNGNVVVAGEKQLGINQGAEYIRFSGVVDPRTVNGDNVVMSTQVADARIEYYARGYIDEAQQMGWLQRFFLNVSPF